MNLFDSKGVLLTGLGFYLRGSGSGSTYGAQARVLLTGLGLVNSTCPIALIWFLCEGQVDFFKNCDSIFSCFYHTHEKQDE